MRNPSETATRSDLKSIVGAAAIVLIAAGATFSRSASVSAQEATASTEAKSAAATPAKASKSGGTDTASKGPTSTADNPFGNFASSKNRGPVDIQSDTMTLDYKGNAVLFKGNVHAKQADGDLWANSLDVKYGKDFHQIQEMLAEGNVRMSQGQRFCIGDHGVMNQAEHTVVLTGSPSCHDDKDEISGDKITVHLDTGKSDVVGRVKAKIFPHEEKTRDNEVPASTIN